MNRSVDKEARAKALELLPYGLFVIGASRNEKVLTIIANWVTQVSFDPPLVAIAIEEDSKMKKQIELSKYFSVNVLPSGSKQFAKAFLKSPEARGNTVAGKEFLLFEHGTPSLKDASAAIECRVVNEHHAGDHRLFIGEVVDAVSRLQGDVLTLRETGWRYGR